MLKLALFFVILVFILFIIFKLLFKLASPLKSLGIAIIVSVILFALITCIMYINDIDYELLGTSKKYVTGQVVSKDTNEMQVRVIEHNLTSEIKRNQTITIKITNDTALRHQTRVLFETSIEISDIAVGDKVNIICDTKKNNIIAQKIVVKY